MKDNGFKIFVTIAFVVMCGYYLYPSVQNYFINSKLESMTEEERIAYEEENNAQIRTVKDKSLKLGLDLLGGMHVTLEVRLDALIRELAAETDATFEAALVQAREETTTGNESMIDAFVTAFQERDPNALLSRYFRSDDANITRRSTNEEVVAYLNQEADEAINRAIEIIRQRVDRFGVTEPSIVRQGTRRIVVELPGVTEEERVRGLLRGTARLEFRLMPEPEALLRTLQLAIEEYEEAPDTTVLADEAEADSAQTAADSSQSLESLLAEQSEDLGPQNRLLDLMRPAGQWVVFGTISGKHRHVCVQRVGQGRAVRLLDAYRLEIDVCGCPVRRR